MENDLNVSEQSVSTLVPLQRVLVLFGTNKVLKFDTQTNQIIDKKKNTTRQKF